MYLVQIAVGSAAECSYIWCRVQLYMVQSAVVYGAECSCIWCRVQLYLVQIAVVSGAECSCIWCRVQLYLVQIAVGSGAECSCVWCRVQLYLVQSAVVTGAECSSVIVYAIYSAHVRSYLSSTSGCELLLPSINAASRQLLPGHANKLQCHKWKHSVITVISFFIQITFSAVFTCRCTYGAGNTVTSLCT